MFPVICKRPANFTLFALLFCVAFASPAAAATHRRATPITLATIAGYASQVAGQPVSIACEAADVNPAWDGWVNFTPDLQPIPVIHLRADACGRLERAATSGGIEPVDFLTLTHESEHVALASLDECAVEHAAVANVWQMVRQFKLTSWRVQAILADIPRDDQLRYGSVC